jgi:dinuclear metal center YbgI/SA1388 family protein
MVRKECKLQRLHSFLLAAKMIPSVADIYDIINNIAPFRYAEDWDNIGLQVGDPRAPVSKIMISLDPGLEQIEQAISSDCRLLLTHHPLIFNPLRNIDLREPTGSLVAKAIRAGLAIISLHTNYDIASGGVNDLLAEKIGLENVAPLSVAHREGLVKLAVFVPRGHEEQVMAALFRFSGIIGNYSDCSFQVKGVGSFKPLVGANPFIGTHGRREYADESRIEVLLRSEDIAAAMAELKSVHPYEEPAVDLYQLLNEGRAFGLGRIGRLPQSVTLEQFVLSLKERFSLSGIRFVGDGSREISLVALCGGSGASLIRAAREQGADLLVTGDIKYHDAQEACLLGISIVDIGHFASELPMVEGLKAVLERDARNKGFDVEFVSCRSERDPFRYR